MGKIESGRVFQVLNFKLRESFGKSKMSFIANKEILVTHKKNLRIMGSSSNCIKISHF